MQLYEYNTNALYPSIPQHRMLMELSRKERQNTKGNAYLGQVIVDAMKSEL